MYAYGQLQQDRSLLELGLSACWTVEMAWSSGMSVSVKLHQSHDLIDLP